MELKGNITICKTTGNNYKKIHIEISDEVSRIRFCDVIMDLDAFADALTGLGFCKCDIDVRGLEHLGKRKERKQLTLKMPDVGWKERDKTAFNILSQNCPDGWTPVNYFGSQGSFFFKDGELYVVGTVERWVHNYRGKKKKKTK